MGAKIGVLLNCGQQSQFSKVRREFDAGRVNLDPPMTCADWPVPGNLTLLHAETAYTGKPWHRDGKKRAIDARWTNGSPRSSRSPTVSPCCNTVQSAGMNRGPAGALPGWTGVPRGAPGSWGPRRSTVEIFRQKTRHFHPVHPGPWTGMTREAPG